MEGAHSPEIFFQQRRTCWTSPWVGARHCRLMAPDPPPAWLPWMWRSWRTLCRCWMTPKPMHRTSRLSLWYRVAESCIRKINTHRKWIWESLPYPDDNINNRQDSQNAIGREGQWELCQMRHTTRWDPWCLSSHHPYFWPSYYKKRNFQNHDTAIFEEDGYDSDGGMPFEDQYVGAPLSNPSLLLPPQRQP